MDRDRRAYAAEGGRMTPELFARACGVPQAVAAVWAEPVSAAMAEYGIDTPLRQAMFLAHCGHETEGFTKLEENLNYSADRLAVVWPNRFAENGKPNALALRLHRNPQAIANHVYANRMGNGPVESGDGWRYRGRGLPHLTGRDNYARFKGEIEGAAGNWPDLLVFPEFAAKAGGWFWRDAKMNAYADIRALTPSTRRWNGGLNGLEDRQKRYARALAALGVSP